MVIKLSIVVGSPTCNHHCKCSIFVTSPQRYIGDQQMIQTLQNGSQRETLYLTYANHWSLCFHLL